MIAPYLIVLRRIIEQAPLFVIEWRYVYPSFSYPLRFSTATPLAAPKLRSPVSASEARSLFSTAGQGKVLIYRM
jgi:hypothetical protein